MSYSVAFDEAGPWLVIEYVGAITGTELVSARAEAASINADASVSDFILDFTDVSEFVLSSEAVDEIHLIDSQRSETLSSGRCAIVVQRDVIEIGATLLAAMSPLELDFRSFAERSEAEAWLRGDLAVPPPTLPRRS